MRPEDIDRAEADLETLGQAYQASAAVLGVCTAIVLVGTPIGLASLAGISRWWGALGGALVMVVHLHLRLPKMRADHARLAASVAVARAAYPKPDPYAEHEARIRAIFNDRPNQGDPRNED